MDGLDPYLVLGMTSSAACAQRADINYQMCGTVFGSQENYFTHA